jgi:hypothetical protein
MLLGRLDFLERDRLRGRLELRAGRAACRCCLRLVVDQLCVLLEGCRTLLGADGLLQLVDGVRA